MPVRSACQSASSNRRRRTLTSNRAAAMVRQPSALPNHRRHHRHGRTPNRATPNDRPSKGGCCPVSDRHAPDTPARPRREGGSPARHATARSRRKARRRTHPPSPATARRAADAAHAREPPGRASADPALAPRAAARGSRASPRILQVAAANRTRAVVRPATASRSTVPAGRSRPPAGRDRALPRAAAR